MPRQVATFERGMPRIVDLVTVDANEVEDFVLVVDHAVEGELKAPRPHQRPHSGELEPNLLSQLADCRVFRGLTRIDPAPWGMPDGWPWALGISTTEQQHAVIGVDQYDSRRGSPDGRHGGQPIDRGCGQRPTSDQWLKGQITATVRPWRLSSGTNCSSPSWHRESSETAR